jgi:hypothetical protein
MNGGAVAPITDIEGARSSEPDGTVPRGERGAARRTE